MPNSYVYYAGCMSASSFHFFVFFPIARSAREISLVFMPTGGRCHGVDIIAGLILRITAVFYKCTTFPTVSLPDRELSTSLANSTDDVVWVNSTVAIAGSS